MSKSLKNSSGGFGWILLLAFVVLQPFHYLTKEVFPLYRELFAALFAGIAMMRFARGGLDGLPRFPLASMALFIAWACGVAWLIEDRELYGGVDDGMLDEAAVLNPGLYVIRNALLYLPLMVFAATLDWTTRRLLTMSRCIALATIGSIIGFLLSRGIILNIGEVLNVIRYGASGLSYNSYVPYLTFGYGACLYLVMADSKKLFKIVAAGIWVFVGAYCAASSSRQSFTFTILLVLLWAWLGGGAAKWLGRGVALCCVLGLAYLFGLGEAPWIENERLSQRIESLDSFLASSRLEKATTGIQMLTWNEYLHGAGVGSVIFSGPHNDYVRWTQRVGVPGMVLGFAPFLWALWASFRAKVPTDYLQARVFIIGCSLFVPFHSLFGYPRDDAFQAPYGFLAVGMAINLYMRRERDDGLGSNSSERSEPWLVEAAGALTFAPARSQRVGRSTEAGEPIQIKG